MSRAKIEMTSGSLWKNIWLFSVPLMCSNVLQVLFNTADVAVVGQFSGPIALGAVGSTTILIYLFTGMFLGMGSGVNSVTALYTGGRNAEQVRKSVHTAALLMLLLGVLVMVCGITLSYSMLRLIGTKDELIAGAAIYMRIYLLGAPALAVFNYGNAVLSAIGDTKRPLKYLTASGITNVILNLIFVILFHLGVVGVALASAISQYLSAVLVLHHLLKCGKQGLEYGLVPAHLRIDPVSAKKILGIGIPSAIQYSLFAIANLFIQSAVNSFDHVVVEGNSAAANADGIVYDMMAAFYTACTSFIAQNLGAGKRERILKTYGVTLFYSVMIAAVLGGILLALQVPFLRLFTSDAQVIAYGRVRLVIMSCSYFVSGFMDNSAAAARGLGKGVMPMVIVISGTVVYRIIWVCTVFAHFRTLPSLYLVFVTAWIFTSIIGNLYLFYCYRKLRTQEAS